MHLEGLVGKSSSTAGTMKEFNQQWKKCQKDSSKQFGIIMSMKAESLSAVFKTEMDSDTLASIVHVLADHVPALAEKVTAAPASESVRAG